AHVRLLSLPLLGLPPLLGCGLWRRSSRWAGSGSGCWRATRTYNATVPRRGRSECSARRAGAVCSESRMVYRHSGSHSGVCLALSTANPTGTSAGTTVPRGFGSETIFLGSAAQRGRRSLALGTERDDEGEGARGGAGYHSAMTAASLESTCHSITRGSPH